MGGSFGIPSFVYGLKYDISEISETLYLGVSVSGQGHQDRYLLDNLLYIPAFTTCREVYSFTIRLYLSFILPVFYKFISD